jgi:hypothetical protein
LSTSSFESIDDAVIRTCCSLPVARSLALTSRMPFASMSNVDLDLGHASRRRRDPVEDEPAERLVVRGELALALEDVDLDLALVVRRGREDLRLRRRDRRVPVDQLRHHATERLDAERQRRHVEEQDVLDVTGEDAGLDRGADADDLVRVDALVGLLAVEHRLDRPRRRPASGSCRRRG